MALKFTGIASPAGVIFSDIAWSPTLRLFVAVGAPASGSLKFFSSPDGVTWTGHSYVSSTRGPTRIIWANSLGKFIAVGTGDDQFHSTVWTSADGLDWSSASNEALGSDITGIAWSDDLNLLILSNGSLGFMAPLGTVFTSPDGSAGSFTNQGVIATNVQAKDIQWVSDLNAFVASLDTTFDPTNIFASSPDGSSGSWTLTAGSGEYYKIAYDPTLGRLAMAAAGSGTVITSDDGGTSWTSRTTNISVFTYLTWGNSEFVRSAGTDVETSPDGVTWTLSAAQPVDIETVLWVTELGIYFAVGTTSGFRFASGDSFQNSSVPVVDAGPDLNAAGPLPSTVTTVASVTPGLNDGTLTYLWTQIAGPGLLTAGPAAPDVTGVGAAGVASYSYLIVAIGVKGDHSPKSTTTVFATGNATLDGTNFNRISGPGQEGISGYDIYRVAGGVTQGKIGSAPPTSPPELAWTFDDKGLVADGSTAPATATAAPTIVSPTSINTDFTFTEYVPAKYVFQLTVTDGLFTGSDQMQVFVPNTKAPSVSSGRMTLNWS